MQPIDAESRKREIAKLNAMDVNSLLVYAITAKDEPMVQYAMIKAMEITAVVNLMPKEAAHFHSRCELMAKTFCVQLIHKLI